MVIQAVNSCLECLKLPSGAQPTERDLSLGRAAKDAHGGGSWISGIPCHPAEFCSSSAAQPADGHTHDDSDGNPSSSVTLSLSPEQMPSLSVTDTAALQFQIAFAVSL